MNVYLPRNPEAFARADVGLFFDNVWLEIDRCGFTLRERDLLDGVMLGRFLSPATRAFFLYHFSPIIEKAVRTIFERRPATARFYATAGHCADAFRQPGGCQTRL